MRLGTVATYAQEPKEWVCSGDFQRHIPVKRNFSNCGTRLPLIAPITSQKALHSAWALNEGRRQIPWREGPKLLLWLALGL